MEGFVFVYALAFASIFVTSVGKYGVILYILAKNAAHALNFLA